MAVKPVFDKSYNITEYEVDVSWRKNVSDAYRKYRKKWDMASGGTLFKFPLCVEIESSYYCNLRCPVCARQAVGTFKNRGIIDEKLYFGLLKEARKHNMPAIMLDHEAEPLTNPNIIKMTEVARESGILDIWMHTNANLLTRDISEGLIRGGITKINFSIDAASEDIYNRVRPGGNFQRLINNIYYFLELKKKLGKKHLRTRVSFVVQENNEHERSAFFEFWKDKVNLIGFQQLLDFTKFKKKMAMSHRRRSIFCYKTWQLLIVRYNGDIVPCGMPLRNYDPKDYLLGNLRVNSIEECWNSPKMNRIRELHLKGQYDKLSFCRNCISAYDSIG